MEGFTQSSYSSRRNNISLYDGYNGGRSRAKFWGLTHYSGELYIKGNYRNQTTWRGDTKDNQQSIWISGGLKAKAGCYFWNPDFMTLDVDAEYSPESHQEKFLVVPDLGEVNTLKNLDIRTVFLNNKPVTFGGNITLNENYSNRENLSDIRSRSKSYGAFMNINNKFAPMSVNYEEGKWYQKEIQTGRIFNVKQSELRSRLQTSFSKWDKHELTYSHSTFSREDFESTQRKSISDQFVLNNDFHFDKKRHYRLNFITTAFDRKLNTNYTRISTIENFTADMPKQFRLTAAYAFYHIIQESQKLDQHNVNLMLGHKLYHSLNTDIFGGYIHSDQSYYKGNDSKLGFDMRYNKKIPMKGSLSLAYKFTWNHRERESSSVSQNVFNEEYILVDGTLTLIQNPYIDVTTLVVTDVTGTIVYQRDIDFVLMTQGNYYEIQRIPGGQIANNASVYMSYTYMQPGLYRYDAANHNFNARLSFFNNIVELYYTYASQNYLKLMQTEFLQLNTFTQNLCGIRLNYKFASAGVEYDNYKSNIIPYYSLGYFVQLQGRFLKHFDGSLNGSMRYMTLTDENVKENSANVSAMLAYNIKSRTRIGLQGSYMHQDYQNIKLNLIMAGLDVTTSIRKIFITLGVQMYKRDYLNEKIIYNGGYVQIARRF
jgi:hypothetical protein